MLPATDALDTTTFGLYWPDQLAIVLQGKLHAGRAVYPGEIHHLQPHNQVEALVACCLFVNLHLLLHSAVRGTWTDSFLFYCAPCQRDHLGSGSTQVNLHRVTNISNYNKVAVKPQIWTHLSVR